ncbi:hypothetical protein [Bartonella sp. MR100HLJHH]|uniref:hypothetical protein n=1 Tax=Bartonella sp. MR100HLJHH TaxID=3243554 RepID=UPI0035CEEB82
MPLPYHTHIFKLEPATKKEVKEGVLDSKALAPVSVGSAAAYEVEYFATAAQGKKADDAVAKRDIGALAYKDKVTIHDIKASGEACENTILSGAGWVKISPLGIGDMKAATYDPDNVGANAFSMENMHEGPTKKILTTEERSKLRWLSSTQPTMEKWRRGDEGVYYPISPVDLKNTIRYFVGSKSVGMSKSVYDPDKIEKDAFDMENMKEGNTHLILTPQERAQVAKIDKIEDVASVAQETADSVQKKVDLIQPLAKKDWIDGTKTVDALISPAKLMASIKANSSNSSGGGSGNNGGGVRKPVEILMTESGDIPLPDGITADTDIEVWAWGGGGGGVKDGGGGGGQCVHVKMKGSDLDKLKTAYIGRGGKGNDSNILCNGGRTMIKGLVTAEGGYSVSMALVNFGEKGGDGGGNRGGISGESYKGGNGGRGGKECGGGGGGYFDGKSGGDKIGGDGGDGAVLIKVYL